MTKESHKRISNQITAHQGMISIISGDSGILQSIETIIELIIKIFHRGNKVWFCGNGGSAADAQHLASELSGKFYLHRKALPAEALHTNTSFITAVGNDYSFDHIYARALEAHAGSGDGLFLLSTSGTSENVVKALETAKIMNIHTIAITGDKQNRLVNEADFFIKIPSQDTPRIQEAMMMIGHIICCEIERRIFAP